MIKSIVFVLTFTLAVVAIGGLAPGQRTQAMQTKATDQTAIEQFISGWKSKPQELARQMIAKYGQPNEATAMRLVWHNNGPWKRTELVNEEIPHNFSKPHTDMLYQTINYRVPPDKAGDLAKYDGSVIVERTLPKRRVKAKIVPMSLKDDDVKLFKRAAKATKQTLCRNG